MNSNALIDTLHTMFPNIPVANIERRRGAEVYYLLLLNYRPIIRRIHGVQYYGFLDMNSSSIDLVFRRGFRSNSLGSQTPGAVDRIPLARLLAHHDDPIYLSRIQSMATEPFLANTFSNNCRYAGILPEFNAIVLKTEEFDMLEQLAMSDATGAMRINGISLPGTVTRVMGGSTVSMTEIVKEWFNGYMMDTNLHLAEMYYKFMSSRPFVPEIQRMNILNEFVPMLVKFSGVYHPILDTTLFDSMCERYPLFDSLEYVENTCKYSGNRIESYFGDEPSYAFYVLRGNLQRLFEMRVDPGTGENARRHGSDMYSPYLYAKMILHVAAEGMDANIFSEDDYPYKVYTVGDGENKEVITINIDDFTSFYGVTCEPDQQIDWLTAAVYNYLLDRNFAAGDPQTPVEINRLVSGFRNRMSPLNLITMEVI